MAKKRNRTVVLIIGWTLIVLGVVGLFLPFLQGGLLLLAGVSVLSSEYVWAHKLLNRMRARFPGLGKRLYGAEAWIRARLRWVVRKKSNPSED